jgi:TATA-box binding protein (TBP) (component of TFIID and TFIIIB)
LTAIKSINNIPKSVKTFCESYNINIWEIKHVKIDCISAVGTVPKGLKYKILILKNNNVTYQISNPPKFPGIILKADNYPSLTYFNSGKIIIMSAKCYCQINKSLNLFNTFIKKIN